MKVEGAAAVELLGVEEAMGEVTGEQKVESSLWLLKKDAIVWMPTSQWNECVFVCAVSAKKEGLWSRRLLFVCCGDEEMFVIAGGRRVGLREVKGVKG